MSSVLRLDILQPGGRVDEILAAVAAAFGVTAQTADGKATFELPIPSRSPVSAPQG